MLYAVLDEKKDVVVLPTGSAIFLTEAEAVKTMSGHPKWTIYYIGKLWP